MVTVTITAMCKIIISTSRGRGAVVTAVVVARTVEVRLWALVAVTLLNAVAVVSACAALAATTVGQVYVGTVATGKDASNMTVTVTDTHRIFSASFQTRVEQGV